MHLTDFQKRINYHGDLKVLFEIASKDYGFGSLKSYKIILQGYEDFNVVIATDKGKYFVKVFSKSRTEHEIQQYVDIMQTAVSNNIAHPKLFTSPDGYLHTITLDGAVVQLTVMEYVDGKDFFALNEKPKIQEKKFIVQQAAKINMLNLKPEFVYDSWAIPNFLKEYEKTRERLDPDDRRLIVPLAEQFDSLKLNSLPHAFVHGDIIATNTMRSKDGKIYIFDFAVANWYPRIQELAILLCDLFFTPDKMEFLANYDLALIEYQKTISLEKEELDILPTYIKLAHAMHIVPATREKVLN